MSSNGNDHVEEPLLEGAGASLAHISQLPASAEALKQRLLVQTAAVVRGRRRRRTLVHSIAACLLYGAGLGTAWVLLPREPAKQTLQPEENALAEIGPVENIDVVPGPVQAPHAGDESNDPWQLRQQVAKASPGERIRLLRKAGDLYLVNSGDVESALNCYRQMMELTPRSQRTHVNPDDTWLLAELKLARHDPFVAAGTNQ